MVTVGCKTTYAGVTFRSRLEAEWAGELDAHGIAWQYEDVMFAEGRDRYTPDFRLARRDIFLEVKPASCRAINPGGARLYRGGVIPGPVLAVFGPPEKCRVIIVSRLPHQELLPDSRWPRGERYPCIASAFLAALDQLEESMPTTLSSTAQEREVIPPTLPTDEEMLIRLGEAVAEFHALGNTARKAIAYLSGLLDRHDALPLDAAIEANEIAVRYLRYRHGPVAAGQQSLKHLVVVAWGRAVRCRIAYRQLSQEGRDQAIARWGAFTDVAGSDNPLWVMCFPQEELDALDVRAQGMGIGRGIPRLVGKDGE
jgi:hypothetical protein